MNIREIKQRFLIVCEGAKTEPNYFNAFRVAKDVRVVIQGVGEDPSTLVKRAEEFSKGEDYDQVWCVFDRDDWLPETFNNAISRTENNQFKIAYSNESFELWYVLHFELLGSAIPRTDYIEKLKIHLGKPYKKNDPNIYQHLLNRQDIAIRNATRLLQQYNPPHPAQDNPSTTVHLLVQELNKHII